MLQLDSVAVNRANINLCGSFLNWIFTTHYLFRESRWGLSTEWEVKMFSSFKQGWKTQSHLKFFAVFDYYKQRLASISEDEISLQF